MQTRYRSFAEFYPYYLDEHRDPNCRRMHFVGSALVLAVAALLVGGRLGPWWLLALPLLGYGFAWAGHALFEHNRPATFRHPWYSLLGDWRMFGDMLRGRIRF